MLNKENFALGVINNIILVNEANVILFIGDAIKNTIYKGSDNTGSDLFDRFPGDEDSKTLEKNLILVRKEKLTRTFFHKKLKKKIIIFPANYEKDKNIIISFEDEIVNANIISSELKERVKELQCLYSISHEINAARTLEEVFEKTTDHMANGFQFPEETSVFIKLDKKGYGIDKSDDSDELIAEKIIVNGEERGLIRVSLSGGKEFLKEEYALLKEVADSFSKTIERVESRADLEKKKLILEKKNLKLQELTTECARNREKLETLIGAITDRIYVVEKGGKISMSNNKDIGDPKGKFESLCKKEFTRKDSPVMQVFTGGKSINLEKNIDDLYYSIRAYPIFSEKENVEKILVMCRNITEKKELENQMLQSNKLASLGKLVAGIAHEINNPNTFIRGNLKIIKESFDDIFPIIDKYHKSEDNLRIARLDYDIFKKNVPFLINDMFEGSNRIKKIVDDLRNYARKDEGFLTDDVDINMVINNAYRLVEGQTRRMAKVNLQLDDNLPVFKGNFQKLEQVIVNMILNAAQSMNGQKGKVLIGSSMSEENNSVEIRVSDNGKGIDDDIISSIFDPFFTTKRNKGGTGLGLSISYGIIKEHGGEITVSSKPGDGTEFRITIPVKRGTDK
ncbi:MAG: ATP-binding protein [Acidobacteriota bacterium]